MKPPVEHVKVSTRAKDILIKIKRHTGLQHWNEICRIALCYSLANPTLPATHIDNSNVGIDMDWATFAGDYSQELSALFIYRATKDDIALKKESLNVYFRNHLERGILSLTHVKHLTKLVQTN